MLADATDTERGILSAVPYQRNDTVLHTDGRLLPKLPRARASWNVQIPREERGAVSLTYWMNKLQRLDAPVDFCVTSTTPPPSPRSGSSAAGYHHPVYSEAAFLAQKRRDEISGVNRTWYCGAWWGYGFHEDGVNSALAVAWRFGKGL
jgi:predicted NAD/FAD-binding protein